MQRQMIWCEGSGADLIHSYDPSKKYIVHVFCIEQNMTLKGETVTYLEAAHIVYVKTTVGFVVMVSNETPYLKWREKAQKVPRR